jgi:hypothetical protein
MKHFLRVISGCEADILSAADILPSILQNEKYHCPVNTEGEVSLLLTSCVTGLESAI